MLTSAVLFSHHKNGFELSIRLTNEIILSTLCLKKVPTFKLSVTLSNLNRFSKLLHSWKAHEICYNTALRQYPSHLRHVATLPCEIKKSNFLQTRNFFEAQCSITMLKFVTCLTTILQYGVGRSDLQSVAVVSPPVPSRLIHDERSRPCY